MKDETIKVLWITTLIVILEVCAMWSGIDGVSLSLAIAALAGLGGYELNNVIKALRGEKNEPR